MKRSKPRMGNSANITVNSASFKKLQVLLPGEIARPGTAAESARSR
jgi:hypothetical protein